MGGWVGLFFFFFFFFGTYPGRGLDVDLLQRKVDVRKLPSFHLVGDGVLGVVVLAHAVDDNVSPFQHLFDGVLVPQAVGDGGPLFLYRGG